MDAAERKKQQEFDWPMAAQRAALKEARLVDRIVMEGKTPVKVYAEDQWACLAAIDLHSWGRGECFVSEPTLALTLQISTRSVERRVRALKQADLITCDLKQNILGTTTNHYRIVWSELNRLRPSVAPLREGDRSASEPDRSARIDLPIRQNGPTVPPGTGGQRLNTNTRNTNLPLLPLLDSASKTPEGEEGPEVSLKEPEPETAEDLAEALNPATRHTPDARAGSWRDAVSSLRAAGMRVVDKAIAIAQARGISPELLAAAAEFYREHAAGWNNPGVILSWATNHFDGDSVRDWSCWRPTTPAYRVRLNEARRCIAAGRSSDADEEKIRRAVAERGLPWPE